MRATPSRWPRRSSRRISRCRTSRTTTCKIVFIQARQEQRWQFTDEDLKPLLDPKVKAFFVVNPGNPYAVALSREVDREDRQRPREASRPDAADRRRLRHVRAGLPLAARRVPAATRIGVYSYSKYFGCTGWRLGVIALHENNVFDEPIAAHPEAIAEGARQALRAADARAAQRSSSSTASSPTAATSR